MDNLLIKYNDFYKVNSVTGLKSYQKVKEVLAEFDVKFKAEVQQKSKDESTLSFTPEEPEVKHSNIWDSGLKINQLV